MHCQFIFSFISVDHFEMHDHLFVRTLLVMIFNVVNQRNDFYAF